MKQLIILWFLMFHAAYFTLQLLLPVTNLGPLFWIAVAVTLSLALPATRNLLLNYSTEVAILTILLILLHFFELATGFNFTQLSFVGLMLLGSTLPLVHYLARHPELRERLDLPFFAVVFAVGFMVLSQNYGMYCGTASATDFDSQNYLTWAFTAYKNYLPYRDVVYWYGLFPYYSATIVSVKVLNILWSLLIFMGIAGASARFIQNKLLLSLFLIIVLVLIQNNAGYSAFFRYGTAFALSIASSYFLSRRIISEVALAVLGAVSAAVLFLITDQGLYFALVVAAQIFLRSWFIETANFKKTFIQLLERYFWFGLGFGSIWLSMIAVLYALGALPGYIENIKAMGMMGIFAKVALSQLLFSKENILTTLTLFVGTQLFLYLSFFAKTKRDNFNYLLHTAWLLTLWFCQNKFLIRPWFETQFIFITFIFFSFQVIVVLRENWNKILSQTTQVALSTSLIIGFFCVIAVDKTVLDFLKTTQNHYRQGYAVLFKPPGFKQTATECLAVYFDNFNLQAPKKYQDVLGWINSQASTGKPTVFSFPGEPIFYLLQDQKPPAFFNAYDATSYAAQQKNLDYLMEKEVRYVIWDTDNLAIQDDVPNILRNNLVAQYILQNFEAKKQVHNYLVLERSPKPTSFLTDTLITANSSFYNSLTSINLKFYPVLLEKKLHSAPRKTLRRFSETSQVALTPEMANNALYLKLSTSENLPIELELAVNETLKTTLQITSCFQEKPCLIPLNQLPLFYMLPENFTVTVKTPVVWEAEIIVSSSLQ